MNFRTMPNRSANWPFKGPMAMIAILELELRSSDSDQLIDFRLSS